MQGGRRRVGFNRTRGISQVCSNNAAHRHFDDNTITQSAHAARVMTVDAVPERM